MEVLRELHRLHPAAIPFENLDPFLGRPVSLELPAVEDKLVRRRRGGYCYEQNLLFSHVLTSLGFEISGLAARVLWGQSADAMTARSHHLLRVDFDSEIWIADVGFGGLTQTAPLILQPGLEQVTSHEPFRILERNGHFHIEARLGDEWRVLYRFDLAAAFDVDYSVSNWFISTHPASHFVTGLIAAKVAPDARYAIGGGRFTIHHTTGQTERQTIGSPAELADILDSRFDIEVPDRTDFEAMVKAKHVLVEAAA
ncbi:MAG: arylamine N-acetyltransferase [Rhizobiaceae bacterium]|nr:arylamine N-acetyltransferase [Rhizobiaceae bacterium]MCV0407807.1 arylamine N-acetyltransferase [Rhizobiaceae bacterium]